MNRDIEIEEFLQKAKYLPVIDVRSSKEFEQGHIPDAFNIPIFNNEERMLVGTRYKNSGKESSVLLGLEIAGLKLTSYVKQAKKTAPQKELIIHCWRGGMRSSSLAWLLDIAGFKVSTLIDGYKSYRKYIRNSFAQKSNIIVLGGMTGSGKTEILHHLTKSGHQVLDLEKIANHKGSAFGDLGQPKQPTNEQFENNLYSVWSKFDHNKAVWIEDESRGIGKVSIPDTLFKNIRNAPVIKIELDKKIRIKRLVKEYANFDVVYLEAAIKRIQRSLGGLNTKLGIEAIGKKDFETAVDLILSYYDKAYNIGLLKRNDKTIYNLALKRDNLIENTEMIINLSLKIRI
ncbi:MAG: tRNA 2-selenouridine(34) synthase MnmH [Bacteroidales bacterium]|nr:tRNA 2-selenouridine(34) synthase MnmH [Bacteroidales bacterium]